MQAKKDENGMLIMTLSMLEEVILFRKTLPPAMGWNLDLQQDLDFNQPNRKDRPTDRPIKQTNKQWKLPKGYYNISNPTITVLLQLS